MKKALIGAVSAVALFASSCGVESGSDDASADATADALTLEERAESLGAELEGGRVVDGADDSPVEDPSDSSRAEGVTGGDGATDDEGSTGSADEPSDASGTGGATPGVYVAPDGGVENGYSLRFEVSDDGSMIHSLEADVQESCDGSSTTTRTTVGADLTWDIVDGTFSARYEEQFDGYSLYTTLEGSFSANTATGTVRQESVVAGSVCDTYSLEFTAELT